MEDHPIKLLRLEPVVARGEARTLPLCWFDQNQQWNISSLIWVYSVCALGCLRKYCLPASDGFDDLAFPSIQFFLVSNEFFSCFEKCCFAHFIFILAQNMRRGGKEEEEERWNSWWKVKSFHWYPRDLPEWKTSKLEKCCWEKNQQNGKKWKRSKRGSKEGFDQNFRGCWKPNKATNKDLVIKGCNNISITLVHMGTRW